MLSDARERYAAHREALWRRLRRALLYAALGLALGVGVSQLLKLLVAPAQAGVSGGSFYDVCESPHPSDEIACKFYIMGALDGLEAQWFAHGGSGTFQMPFCAPKDTTREQLVDIVLGWLAALPSEVRSSDFFNGAELVTMALRKTFPPPDDPEYWCPPPFGEGDKL